MGEQHRQFMAERTTPDPVIHPEADALTIPKHDLGDADVQGH
jgi:hypothetical protein